MKVSVFISLTCYVELVYCAHDLCWLLVWPIGDITGYRSMIWRNLHLLMKTTSRLLCVWLPPRVVDQTDPSYLEVPHPY